MSHVGISYDQFADHLLEKTPELKPLYDEHISDYDEVLQHVFLADVTRFIMSSSNNRDCIKRIISILQLSFESSDEVLRELIAVSFIENLPQDHPFYPELKSLLPPSLTNELSLWENF